MNPAPSVILFTVASGAGFGMLIFLGAGVPAPSGWQAFFLFALAYILAIGGLTASAFHLANPKNARKAFSQWRSSWLSREAILAVLALSVSAINAFTSVFLSTRQEITGIAGGLLSAAAVLSTGMIYAQLRAIPRWSSPLTPLVFIAASLAGGALLTGNAVIAVFALLAFGLCQLTSWIYGDTAFLRSGTTIATATGIAGERTSLFEPPHTGSNYLLNEMVYHVGRKHSRRLRVMAITLAFILPVALLFVSTAVPAIAIAALLHLGGMLIARWLFFAEAEHVVGLYYGRAA